MDKPLSAPRGPDDGGKKQKRPREASSGREGADKRGRRDGRRDGGRRGGGRGGGGGRGDGPRHRGGRGGRIGGTGPRRAPDRDTVRFSYKWAVTPEKQRVPTGAESTSDRGAVASLRAHGMGPVRPDPIKKRGAGRPDHRRRPRLRLPRLISAQVLTVRAFGAELMKIGSGGSLEISSGGFRTWRTFQALNMVLAPVGLELEADPEGRGAGYRGGKWSLTSKNGWTLPFEDDMKLSAFPTRDWKRILPQLESLPEDVEFVVAKD